jgi:Bacterial SH3 domain
MRARSIGWVPVWLAVSGTALACGGAPICTVADPTGTPLNIRLSPNGPVIGSAKNGTPLAFIEHREVDGKTWALVERFNDGELAADFDGAWVFGAYLDCKGTTLGLPKDPYSGAAADPVSCTVADPTGTPLNTRAEPGGEIFATLRNGTVVRAIAQTRHDGKQWVFVEKWTGDNAVGWVFDAYMACEEEESH